MHAQLAGLHWNTIVVHYHFWFETLVDYVCVRLRVVVHILTLVHQHVLSWCLEGLMHIVDLSIGPDTPSLRDNLLLIHKLAAT